MTHPLPEWAKVWAKSVDHEVAAHYAQCLQWIDALEYWIRRQGLEVPTWRDMEIAGWKPSH
jgi:hypothetical protein